MYRKTRRYGLQAHVYATSPWALIEASIQERCPSPSKAEAVSFLRQAHYFYRACADADEWQAKPLLLYYSFMNLAKAYILTESISPSLDKARHGLSERRQGTSIRLEDAYLTAFPSVAGANAPNVFSHFLQALSGNGLATQVEYPITSILPQIVAGHRLWCDAAAKRERFIPVNEVAILFNENPNHVWLDLRIFADDLSRLDMTRKELLEGTSLNGVFREVDSTLVDRNRKILRFEQVQRALYGHRVSDAIPDLVRSFRHRLWATAVRGSPFRYYYIYVSPSGERKHVLPQLAGIYAAIYYLGSVTRYRPQQFDALLQDKYGGQIQEILSSQPGQFLFLIASEFARREVTHPAIA
jgi:hypothetical protein